MAAQGEIGQEKGFIRLGLNPLQAWFEHHHLFFAKVVNVSETLIRKFKKTKIIIIAKISYHRWPLLIIVGCLEKSRAITKFF